MDIGQWTFLYVTYGCKQLLLGTEYSKIGCSRCIYSIQNTFYTFYGYCTVNLWIPKYFIYKFMWIQDELNKNMIENTYWPFVFWIVGIVDTLAILLFSGSQLHWMRSLVEHALCWSYNLFNMIWIKFIFPVIRNPVKDPWHILDQKWAYLFLPKCINIR